MARPLKEGLDYFPIDVSYHRNKKIRKLKLNHGIIGAHVYLCILMLVYEAGYYLEVSKEELAEMVYEELRGPGLRSIDRITDVISFLAKSGLLEESLLTEKVITSTAIQKQWLASVSRRKNIDKSKHWLLSSEDEAGVKKNSVPCVLSANSENDSVHNILVNVDNNQVNDNDNTQRKSKDDKYDKKDKRVYGEPKLHFITHTLIKQKYIDEADPMISSFNDVAEGLVYDYGYDIVLSATNYVIKYSKKTDIEITNRFEFFKTSMENNCSILKSQNQKGGNGYGKSINDFLEELVKKYSK